ncbi:MAG: hypothetical protein QOI66_4803 [Myxococcales bacterium]|nr:hypothetical protein [Myxococcales bacterium]
MVRAHANALYPILSDPALHTFTGGSPPRSEASLAEVYVRRESRRSPDGDELWLNWLIQERELGTAIGYAQATISFGQTLVAWVIGGSWQRRGYGSEAAQGLVAWLDILEAPEIRACVHPCHIASQKVAHRAGLRSASQFLDGEEVWIVNRKNTVPSQNGPSKDSR